MSEPEEQTERAAQSREPRGWLRFHEQQVLLQLREPYGGVKVAANGMVIPASMAEVGSVPADDPAARNQAFAQAVPGRLYVEPNGSGGVVLVLKTLCANGTATVALDPEAVLYCTMAESRLVHQPS
jgi:hypothetical protein